MQGQGADRSVPIPKFASLCGSPVANFGMKDTATY